MKVKHLPKNKEQFERLKVFTKEIIEILNSIKVKPILWGSLAFFAYTKPKKFTVNDIDLLIPKNSLKTVLNILKEKEIRYNYVDNWNFLNFP